MARNGTGRVPWDTPITILGWEDDPDFVEERPDGTFRRLEIAEILPRDIDRMRQGYLCAWCWNPQPEAFPEKCRFDWCNFPMKERQTEYMGRYYRDNKRTTALNGFLSAEEEAEVRRRDLEERALREKYGRSQSTILVPRGI